jgi:hypothetical protein
MEICPAPRDNLPMPRGAPPPSDPRRFDAASRLRHDLGKAVRFSAPAAGARESTEALRIRLIADLLETRSAARERLNAAAVFDRWVAADGALFASDAASGARLDRIRAAIDVMRPRLPRLRSLALGDVELRELDEAARVIDEETRALRAELASGTREGTR